jgi:hypothetical protein
MPIAKKKNLNESWDQLSQQAKELVLHGDNSQFLELASKQPIMRNLAKKLAKGIYKKDLARKLWGYHSDRCAQDYCKTNGPKDQPWHKTFTPGHRKEAASHWEEMHHDELKENTFNTSPLINENILSMFAEKEEVVNETVNPLFNLINYTLEKKPVEFNETFNALLTKRISGAVENYKHSLRLMSEDMIGAKSSFLNKPTKKNDNTDNAIHASIHLNDTTGMHDDLKNKSNKNNFNNGNKNKSNAIMHDDLKNKSNKNNFNNGNKNKSNAIHASIHADDTTGMDD